MPADPMDPDQFMLRQKSQGAFLDPDEFMAKQAGIKLHGSTPERSGGQKVLDYTTDTLSNVPRSAVKLAENIGTAVAHPVDTAKNVLGVVGGTLEKMTPDTPSHAGRELVPHADAAWDALKDRYGSPSAFAESLRTDPVGVAADIAALAGGVSGAARGAGVVARAANLPRVASTAGRVADVAGAVSDTVNPLNAVTKPVGAVLKATAKPLVKSALDLRGKTERYGATPATAALEETKGLTPLAIKESATAKLADLNQQLEQLAAMSGNKADLTPVRNVIEAEIAKVKAANGIADDLTPMRTQLNDARPGFQGAVTPAGGVAAQQNPSDFLRMKRQFGDDFTKFDAAIPLKDSTRKVGNQAYHEMSTEFNRAVPGAQEINQRMQSLVPVKEGAARAHEGAGPIQRSINRATRPTGGLAATLLGFAEGGVPGAIAALAGQEAIASPTVKMGVARGLYGAGKGVKSPITPRTLNTLGVEGEAGQDDIPRFAKGGIVRKPTLALVGEAGPEAIVPLTAARSTIPEKPDAIAEQLGQLSNMKRRVVMIPRGTFPHAAPQGMVTHADHVGNRFVFNPNLISVHDIKTAVATNRLTSILGATHGGMGAPDKSRLRGSPVNVAAKSPRGFTLQSTATDKPNLQRAIKQSRKILPKGGKIAVESPDKEIARRLRA